jgi:hypothetical protein
MPKQPADGPSLPEQTSRSHLAGGRASLQGGHPDRPRLHPHGHGRHPNRVRPDAGSGNSSSLEDDRSGRGLSVVVDEADDHIRRLPRARRHCRTDAATGEIGGTEFIILPGVGHLSPLEAPSELAAAITKAISKMR